MNLNKYCSILTAAVLTLGLLGGCGDRAASAQQASSGQTAATAGTEQTAAQAAAVSLPETGDLPACDIQLEGDTISVSGSGVQVSGTTATINAAGRYTISGTLNDGQILVDANKDSDVVLVLNGASITCRTSAPIYGVKSNSMIIETAAGTENTITDGENYMLSTGQDEPDGAIFSKDDLYFTGEGSLTVRGSFDKAVHGKDEVFVLGGTLMLESAGDGLKGKDRVEISQGTVNINAGSDGIQSNNDLDAGMGVVSITGGDVTIQSVKDGIDGETLIELAGGSLTITAQEDGLNATDRISIGGGQIALQTGQDGIQGGGAVIISGGSGSITAGGGHGGVVTDDTLSMKGIKSDTEINITGGTYTIDALDDGIKSKGILTIAKGASLTIQSADDAYQADGTVDVAEGTVILPQAE